MTKAKALTPIHICPNCGSKNIGKISLTNNYCSNCCIEFNNSGEIFEIQDDGELIKISEETTLKTVPNVHKTTKQAVNNYQHLENEFIELYNQGLSYYLIAKQFEVKISIVRYYLTLNKMFLKKRVC